VFVYYTTVYSENVRNAIIKHLVGGGYDTKIPRQAYYYYRLRNNKSLNHLSKRSSIDVTQIFKAISIIVLRLLTILDNYGLIY